MTSVDASIKIHSRIGIVVFDGTALETILTPFARFCFVHNDFHKKCNSFRICVEKSDAHEINIDLYKINSAFVVLEAVNKLKTISTP